MAETLERNYVVPLRRGFLKTAPYKRSKKAVKTLKEFISKHMKSEKVLVGKELNELIWKHGIKNPPGKVSVTAVKDKDGKVMVNLEGIKPAKEEKPAKKEVKEKLEKVAENAVKEATEADKKKEAEVKEQKDVPNPDKVKPEVKEEDVKAEIQEEKGPMSEKDRNLPKDNQKY